MLDSFDVSPHVSNFMLHNLAFYWLSPFVFGNVDPG